MRTDTVAIPVIDGEVVTTTEIPAPWRRPPTTVRYHYRHPGRWQRFARSEFARDVRKRTGDALAVLGGVGFMYLLCIAYQWAVLFGLAPAVHP